MKIKETTRKNLAKILYAFEDPDSNLFCLEPGTTDFDLELTGYVDNYDSLLEERKKSLEQAVSWFLLQKITSEKDFLELVPDLYRRIWIHEQDTQSTESIINELDIERYTRAMEYIFKQALVS